MRWLELQYWTNILHGGTLAQDTVIRTLVLWTIQRHCDRWFLMMRKRLSLENRHCLLTGKIFHSDVLLISFFQYTSIMALFLFFRLAACCLLLVAGQSRIDTKRQIFFQAQMTTHCKHTASVLSSILGEIASAATIWWPFPGNTDAFHFKPVAIQLCSHNILPFVLNGYSFTCAAIILRPFLFVVTLRFF